MTAYNRCTSKSSMHDRATSVWQQAIKEQFFNQYLIATTLQACPCKSRHFCIVKVTHTSAL